MCSSDLAFLRRLSGDMAREAFGPNLRRVRVQRGVTLEYIATTTKIPVDLLVCLEANDFQRWPSGIFA